MKKEGNNFLKTRIIQMFDTEQSAYDHEALLVDGGRLSDPDCMNKVLGGRNGYVTTMKDNTIKMNQLWKCYDVFMKAVLTCDLEIVTLPTGETVSLESARIWAINTRYNIR